MFLRFLSSYTETKKTFGFAAAARFKLVRLLVGPCVALALSGTIARADEPISAVPAPVADPFKVALGKALFNDPRLSGDGTRSCATCHDMSTNGASGRRLDRSPDGAQLPFNTPTVFNAALNFRLNWEGNFSMLQDHAKSLIRNPQIMGGEMVTVLRTLGSDPAIRELAEAAYGEPLDEGNLMAALAAYQTSLILIDSPFDRWLAGDAQALTDEEKRGYRRFQEVGCATCHQGRNAGGNLYQRHGIFHPLTSTGPERLRVPSLRTVYYTPPYFHDGSAETLGEAIRAMGRAQLDVILSEEDVTSIEAFLKSLAGSYEGKSLRKAAR